MEILAVRRLVGASEGVISLGKARHERGGVNSMG